MTLISSLDDQSRDVVMQTGYNPPRIFVANWAGHDFSAALEYTSLPAGKAFVAVTEGDLDFTHMDRLSYRMGRALWSFEEQDYLLLSGDSLVNVIAVSILLYRMQAVKVLQYRGRSGGYRQVHISQDIFVPAPSVSSN